MFGFEVKIDPSKAEIDRLVEVLVEATQEARSDVDGPVEWGIFLTDPATGEQSGGGATGYMVYDWMYVQFFAVPAALRGQGVGRALMDRVEAWGRERGLIGIFLDTFEFQSRGFYEKLGFTLFGTIADHPRGQHRYFLEKRLDRSVP
jgi:GNAT superfamily N-acetyltransferase